MAFNSKYKSSKIEGLLDKVEKLADVATSGSYNDLADKPTIPAEQVNADWNATSGKAQILNKPTIPSAVTESTVSGWGFTKNTGNYSKPSSGIPKSDLASAVQASLGKADSALQSYTEQYKGTVTGVKINGSTKNPSNGVVDLGTVITSHQDISGKQDKLVSGTNIKTINGQSIVGSGNITISGGGGEQIGQPQIDDMYVAEYGEDYYIVSFTVYNDPEHPEYNVNQPMLPNRIYICPIPIWYIYIDTLQPPTSDIGKYTFHFSTSNATDCAISIENHILMANGDHPYALEPNTTYELSIVATKINGDYVYKGVLTSFS